MYKNLFILALLAGFALLMLNLIADFGQQQELSEVAQYYANKGPEEVGAANLVTAVVVSWRGLDTLGEVSILFLTAAIIGFFLKTEKTEELFGGPKSSELLQTAAKVLVPMMFLFGAYVFINGHLTPGGGFQGGAIIASAVALMILAQPNLKLNHKLISIVESISGISIVLLAVLGLFLAGGFLDNSYLGLGKFGELFSAGAVPLIYIFVGLKVGAELSGILANYKETQSEVE